MELLVVLGFLSFVQPAPEPGPVGLALTASPNNQQIAPGSAVQWTMTAFAPEVGTGTHGLAAICVDLVQSPANPRLFNMPPGGAAPLAMVGFSRPQGVSNPGPGGMGSGYGGTPVGTANASNLVQIGGAQNTFGVPGVNIGLTTAVSTGIAQNPAGQVVATGVFYAPAGAGSYSFALENGLANLIAEVRTPPDPSVVVVAETILTGSIIFTIQCPPDWNGDGQVNSTDISAFLTAWLDSVNNGHAAADFNGDGAVNSTDISAHLTAWLDAVENGC